MSETKTPLGGFKKAPVKRSLLTISLPDAVRTQLITIAEDEKMPMVGVIAALIEKHFKEQGYTL